MDEDTRPTVGVFLRGGYRDGKWSVVRTDATGKLLVHPFLAFRGPEGRVPMYGAYWPTHEMRGRAPIYQWHEGDATPPWIELDRWPKVVFDTAGKPEMIVSDDPPDPLTRPSRPS